MIEANKLRSRNSFYHDNLLLLVKGVKK